MNRTRWLILLLLSLVAMGWWSFRSSDVRLSFLRYEEVNGEPYAVLKLENRSSAVLFCCGKPGAPDCHFRAEYPDGTMMGPASAATSGIPGDLRIAPGDQIEFPVRLRLEGHKREVTAPFKAAIKFTTDARLARHRFLHGIRFPYRFRPPIEDTVWTDLISH